MGYTRCVSRKAWSANFPESSKMFIKPGDAVTVKELMLGLIVQSGNDAAVALAEHVAGDEVAFVSLMNGWAQSLGMSNTQFVNAHGLDGEDISSTPRDMALLLKSVIQDVPRFTPCMKNAVLLGLGYNNTTVTSCCGTRP